MDTVSVTTRIIAISKSLTRDVDRNRGFDSLRNFLKCTPLLTSLSLSFLDEHWTDTEIVFRGLIAEPSPIILPHLKVLMIDGLRCKGGDLALFLRTHKSLEAVELNNLDLIGPHRDDTFADILKELAQFEHLTNFSCKQIAQHGFRINFPTLCIVQCIEMGWPWDQRDFGVEITYPNVWVSKNQWQAVAEEWEGVSSKLVGLSRDVVVTALEFHSDSNLSYTWNVGDGSDV
jgi:hypothetical protein